uniref:Dynamin-type G domain-containing protein n=1 Tax=Ditylenchus dipsaci TaxID=166011 RepID=A0A915DI72_9BILA
MERLVELISQISQILPKEVQKEMQLPRIVVVGAQSGGKSSLLNRLMGKDIMPGGTGMVTQKPLVMTCIHVKLDDPRRIEKGIKGDWVVFSHMGTEIFENFACVHKEIDTLSKSSVKENHISDEPISLTFYSHNVLANLSLVDLPGLVETPAKGQPADIKQQIENLCLSYITNPNSIILVVTPANQDMATSQPLNFARRVDPEGLRTLVVVTKLDLMDRGVSARDVLNGKYFPNKLGICGVVNRCQQDLNDNVSVEKCERSEREFLEKIMQTSLLKTAHPSCEHDLTRCMGTNIRVIYEKDFYDELKSMKCLENMSDEHFQTAIENQDGIRSPYFSPRPIFEKVVLKEILEMKKPSKRILLAVQAELLNGVRLCKDQVPEFKRFPKIYEAIKEVVVDVLKNDLKPETEKHIEVIFERKSAFPYSADKTKRFFSFDRMDEIQEDAQDTVMNRILAPRLIVQKDQLVVESPEIAKKRAEGKKKIEDITSAKAIIEEIEALQNNSTDNVSVREG